MEDQNYRVWLSKTKKADKVIIVTDSAIYKGNPKEDPSTFKSGINEEKLKGLFSIPYTYIKSVENQDKVKHIKIFYGKDLEEELNIVEESLKSEVFDYIKTRVPNFKYEKKLPNEFKYVKGPAFAMISVFAFFAWTMYYTVQLSNGVEYELTGRPGLGSIIFSIANLGYFKVIVIYLVLFFLSFFALLKRIRTRTETEYLIR